MLICETDGSAGGNGGMGVQLAHFLGVSVMIFTTLVSLHSVKVRAPRPTARAHRLEIRRRQNRGASANRDFCERSPPAAVSSIVRAGAVYACLVVPIMGVLHARGISRNAERTTTRLLSAAPVPPPLPPPTLPRLPRARPFGAST